MHSLLNSFSVGQFLLFIPPSFFFTKEIKISSANNVKKKKIENEEEKEDDDDDDEVEDTPILLSYKKCFCSPSPAPSGGPRAKQSSSYVHPEAVPLKALQVLSKTIQKESPSVMASCRIVKENEAVVPKRKETIQRLNLEKTIWWIVNGVTRSRSIPHSSLFDVTPQE